LGTGTLAEIATYGPGEKVLGVIVTGEEIEVHIVASYPLKGSVPELADEVREKVAPEAEGRKIEVVVDDLAMPGEEVADDASV
jgi:hypothetical protein